MEQKIKNPPKSTVEKNIMMFIQKFEGATTGSISSYLGLQETITLSLLKSLQKRTYITKVDNVWHSNYFYPKMP